MITIRKEQASDVAARDALLDKAMGKIKRRRKTSERLRSGRMPADGLSFVAVDGDRIVGTIRLWNVDCGNGEAALLLGPMAVASDCRNQGIGGHLAVHAINAAKTLGHRAIILVGDEAYYSRFGFSAAKTGNLTLPGPFERHRLLALELVPGALDAAQGMVSASGRLAQKPQRRAA